MNSTYEGVENFPCHTVQMINMGMSATQDLLAAQSNFVINVCMYLFI